MARIEPDRQFATMVELLRHHAATLRNLNAGPAPRPRAAAAIELIDEAAKLLDEDVTNAAPAAGRIERYGR